MYLVSDFCAGGELFHALTKQGLVLEATAKVYIAEVRACVSCGGRERALAHCESACGAFDTRVCVWGPW